MNIVNKIKAKIQTILLLEKNLEKIQLTLGKIEARQLEQQKSSTFNDHEMQVFSQWGEDGLIQFLIKHVAIERPIFVEFGVEKYTESNTRFLLKNNNWSGLVIDGSEDNINYIKNDPIYWQHNLKVEHAFIDKDNINHLIEKNGISGDIGLLSIDIDGNDYWIWQAIDVIKPRIVVCEYNSTWGPDLAVSTIYDAKFERTKKHFSNLYYGASISALTQLGASKGYSLIGSGIEGVNVFFVRNDLIGALKVVSPQAAYVETKIRQSRDENGMLSMLSIQNVLKLMQSLELSDIDKDKVSKIGKLYNINNIE
jgi:hypothetical protein